GGWAQRLVAGWQHAGLLRGRPRRQGHLPRAGRVRRAGRGVRAGRPHTADGGRHNKAPSFSPDGQWIAFASNLRGDNNVFIMRVDGSDWRQLTTQPSADWQPRWGP